MKTLPLTRGKFAIVSDETYEWASAARWQCNSNGYAVRSVRRPDGTRTAELLHRVILGLKPGDPRQGDHINGNPADNRPENLRIVTHRQNQQAFKKRYGSSKFRGVSWDSQRQKWRAVIKAKGKLLHLGYFHDEEAAARAYDEAAIKYFGEYADLNFKEIDLNV